MFSDQERQIFEYANWNGQRRFADPARVLRRIKEHTHGEFGRMIKDMSDPDHATASVAVESLIQTAVYAFELEACCFDQETGEGWTEILLISLIDRFNKYVNGLKKNTPA